MTYQVDERIDHIEQEGQVVDRSLAEIENLMNSHDSLHNSNGEGQEEDYEEELNHEEEEENGQEEEEEDQGQEDKVEGDEEIDFDDEDFQEKASKRDSTSQKEVIIVKKKRQAPESSHNQSISQRSQGSKKNLSKKPSRQATNTYFEMEEGKEDKEASVPSNRLESGKGSESNFDL